MAELSRIVFNDAGLQELEGVANRHVDGIGARVVNQAIQNASGRPGPRIRTGDLVEEIRAEPGADARGHFVDVGSEAEHRGYAYPSRLETGEDGHHYPWLVPALEAVMDQEQ